MTISIVTTEKQILPGPYGPVTWERDVPDYTDIPDPYEVHGSRGWTRSQIEQGLGIIGVSRHIETVTLPESQSE